MGRAQYRFSILLPVFFMALGLWRCAEAPAEPEQLVRVTEADFAEAEQVSPQLAEGFKLELWAPGPLLSNAVALSFDPNGVAYVAETERRKSSDIDIRAHRDWVTEDLSLESLEDTRAFHLRKLATELSDENTWLEDFNEDGIHDYRDLEVQTEYVRRIWDSDGDGRADVSHLFASGFNTMLTGVAAGVLHHDDEVYLTVAPDVWRLKDENEDGIADERESISHGYGIHIAYAGHDMSGLTMGPDGKLYWSIGDMGVNVVDENGKRWAYPHEGCVMRANPDGSDFEIFAHGLRNPQELAFDAYGNLISVDNDGDHPGEHERFVHIVEGSDSGWRMHWQFGKYNDENEFYKVWMDEKLHVPHFPGQAAFITPPLALAPDGPAGLAYQPGAALSSDWGNYFFASYFTGSSARSKVQAFRLAPKGASYKVEETVDVLGGIVPTGVTFGPDGALYVNDWKDSYDKKPEGRIWKLDMTENDQQALRVETQQLLQEGMVERPVSELGELLAHSDMRVRMAAQFELAKRKEKASMLSVLENGEGTFARLHAIWGIGQLARENGEEAASLASFLKDGNEHVRAQSAKTLGEAKYAPAFEPLVQRLQDTSARVRFYAAEALGKLGNKEAFKPLVDLLERVGEDDPHLRHAVVYALSRLGDAEALAGLADHPSRYVRIGAVVALRKLRAPEIVAFLDDEDPLVLTETARAINDDLSIPKALPALAAHLTGNPLTEEAYLRRVINANLRLADRESAERLAIYAANTSAPEAMRTDALWALGYWPAPPVLDRVDGRYRELSGHRPEDARSALAKTFEALSKDPSPAIRAASVTAAARLNYTKAEPRIFALLKDAAQPTKVRLAALQALTRLESDNITQAIDIALSARAVDLRGEAQSLLGELELPAETRVAMLRKVLENNSIPEQQRALTSLGKMDVEEAKDLLNSWMDKLVTKEIAPELQLDLLMAVENSSFDELKALKANYEQSKDSLDVLARYEEALYGGNARRGARIFYGNTTAQCIRCHVLDGEGGAVGPELTHVARQLDREALLISLVDPSARLAPGYGTVVLKLNDGREVVGVLLSEDSETITIREAEGNETRFELSAIEERQTLPSGMISMANVLTKAELRDLVAFLVEQK